MRRGILIGVALLLSSCTAQQWQTTKQIVAVTALVGLAGVAASQPVAVTRCRTEQHGGAVTTVCASY